MRYQLQPAVILIKAHRAKRRTPVLCLLTLAASIVSAQTTPPPPPPPPGQGNIPMSGVQDLSAWVAPPNVAYSIISVRPHNPGTVVTPRLSPDSIRLADLTLRSLISEAWNIDDDKLLTGGPGWAASDRFDVEAKIDADDLPPQRLLLPQLFAMLQPVLTSRFQLRMHHEAHPFPVYNLVLAKAGIKMKPAAASSLPVMPGTTGCLYGIKSAGFRSAHNCSIDDIAQMFSHSAGRRILNKTGLTGRYDFEFCYSNERTPEGDPNFDCPTLFTAFQEQLGLKLEPATAPLDVLVIDSAQKPSAN
ncbi:MAG TPA: TIGR03435 family protein [Acidobacteriaceae bacterium]|nr:TIGR03435 family protein [Acidobacteriaceae bacterium]